MLAHSVLEWKLVLPNTTDVFTHGIFLAISFSPTMVWNISHSMCDFMHCFGYYFLSHLGSVIALPDTLQYKQIHTATRYQMLFMDCSYHSSRLHDCYYFTSSRNCSYQHGLSSRYKERTWRRQRFRWEAVSSDSRELLSRLFLH
jgi:hypothetical protein